MVAIDPKGEGGVGREKSRLLLAVPDRASRCSLKGHDGICHAIHRDPWKRFLRSAGLLLVDGKSGDNVARSAQQFAGFADKAHGHEAAVRGTDHKDGISVAIVLGNQIDDDLLEEADVVRVRGTITSKRGSPAVVPMFANGIRRDDDELVPLAQGGEAGLRPNLLGGLGAAMENNDDRMRTGLTHRLNQIVAIDPIELNSFLFSSGEASLGRKDRVVFPQDLASISSFVNAITNRLRPFGEGNNENQANDRAKSSSEAQVHILQSLRKVQASRSPNP